MSVSLDEKLAPAERSHGTKARATLAQLRKRFGFKDYSAGFVRPNEKPAASYEVCTMGGPDHGGSWEVWDYIFGIGKEAVYERR